MFLRCTNSGLRGMESSSGCSIPVFAGERMSRCSRGMSSRNTILFRMTTRRRTRPAIPDHRISTERSRCRRSEDTNPESSSARRSTRDLYWQRQSMSRPKRRSKKITGRTPSSGWKGLVWTSRAAPSATITSILRDRSIPPITVGSTATLTAGLRSPRSPRFMPRDWAWWSATRWGTKGTVTASSPRCSRRQMPTA